MPKLSERARRLIDALNLLWSSRRSAVGLASLLVADPPEPTDDEMYAADTAALLAVKAQMPTDCPMVGCTNCRPNADELEVNRTAWWLITALPEIWYRAKPAETHAMAAALVTLRRGVEGGRWRL